ncbi:adhesion G-protein coupled receptor G6 isoform X5 [Protopterus annectens]|uniref:adhesion G-protein coupled receptor G6 isoform X5 n=1 Tax=Protopterus annectens TaxID=7888 RepID=UPI001CF9F43E|nr:adhesion G-protein coupled receptor G6 isoform X5 [Protopterus annectens]
MSHMGGMWYKYWQSKSQRFFYFIVVVVIVCTRHKAHGCADCRIGLTNPSGYFTSPCYPSVYPNSQACEWKILAPPGFIIKLIFVDFELEEAQKCIYDYVVVYTGESSRTFCGLTANRLSFTSTGNTMNISFTSDFSVQKKGFNATYWHVAVLLRNQKVTLTKTSSESLASVKDSIPIPKLKQFTICLEAQRSSSNVNNWMLFSYADSSSMEYFSFGRNSGSYYVSILGTFCDINGILPLGLDGEIFGSTWQEFCISWDSTSGTVSTYIKGNLDTITCVQTVGKVIPANGILALGSQSASLDSFNGDIYNFRLWNFTISLEKPDMRQCEEKGNIVDWENDMWSIPTIALKEDYNLSCGTQLQQQTTTQPRDCSQLGVICQGDLYYKIVIIINNQNPDAVSYVEHNVSLWLNQTFQNWNYSVYVKNVSAYLLSRDRSAKVRNRRDVSYARYFCHALLVYSPMNNITLNEDTIRKRIVRNNETIATGLQLESVMVDSIENCKPEEIPSHYSWISTRPNVTREIQCYLDSGQTASRKCVLNEQNYTSYWDTPQLENCENIKVTSDNAADVANQIFLDLADGQSLNSTQVEKFVLQLNQIVNIAEINTSLASTVVTVFSRILNNNDEALVTSSSLALKTVDELAQKIQFTGPSVSITSPNLALGILAMNTSSYNGSSFSTGQGTNGTSLQVNFGSHDTSSLASVVLPPSLLENLTELERDMLSRSQFSFFHKIGLFQDKHLKNQVNNTEKLISYVVASSIGNMSISGLHDPVQVTVKHAPNKNENGTPYCVFWDFQLYNGSGGWNKTGCRVSSSNTSETVCFCNHLTNFAILMDIQGSSQNIGSENEKALTFITYIGCGLSAICSATTVLTYIAFEKLRRDYPSKILMNLSTAIMFLNLVFLVDGWLASFKIGGLCIAVAALLHFFLLTSITWMGLEAVHMYIALVKVFNTYIRRYILKFCIVGWGLPLLIVVIVLAATNGSAYGQQPYGEDDKGARASEFCWILNRTVFYVTCVGYFCVVFLMNIAMFIVVMLQICGRNGKRCHQSATEEIMRNLRSSVSLTFLLGMTWGFAFFAWGPLTVPFFYLFTICNSLQGFFIFIFHCALKDNVQKQWRRYLCCGKLRLPENSDWSKTTTPKKPSSGSGSGSASDNLGKSLSSTSLASNSTNWTNKSKSSSTHFFKRNSNADNVFVDKTSTKSASIDKEQMTIIPVHQVIDKVKDYCSVRSDNFYKNIIMSDSFSHSTKF